MNQLPGEASADGRHPGLVTYADYIFDGAGAAGTVPLFARLPDVWKVVATLAGPVRPHSRCGVLGAAVTNERALAARI